MFNVNTDLQMRTVRGQLECWTGVRMHSCAAVLCSITFAGKDP
jgi:hypothetical protein